MKLPIISRFLFVPFIICLHLHLILQSHGFCEQTVIKRCDLSMGGYIVTVCRRAAKGERVCIPSYDTDTHTYVSHKKVKQGGQSSVPRHVRLSCASDYFDVGESAIACSPLQEFYCVDTHRWVPAYQLHIGNRVMSYSGPRAVTHLGYIEKELKVYALEIEPPHTFFVGQEELLTHNMALPGSWATITPLVAFGSGAALSVGGGAAAGSLLAPFLAPVVLVAGLALSGALSALIKTVCSDAVPTYHAAVDGICSFFGANQDDQGTQDIGDSNQSSSSPSGGPKKDDDRDFDKKPRNTDKYENMYEVFKRAAIGKKLKDAVESTRFSYKSVSKIFKVIKDITEYGIQKGDWLYLDKMHGDHIEVFKKCGTMIRTVLNMDGTKNWVKYQNALSEGRNILRWIR